MKKENFIKDSKLRFSNRVENYIKYRPSYPIEVVALLQKKCGMTRRSILADIGSGTGIFTQLLVDKCDRVYAVEPNHEMRSAAESHLNDCDGFISINGSAEETGLKSSSVDIIASAQAFHWFDRNQVKKEFMRILRDDGWIVILWNQRKVASTEFLMAYEGFLHTYARDYREVNHANIDSGTMAEFFHPSSFETTVFENHQILDYEGFKGRVLSCSYIPGPEQPEYKEMLKEMEKLFQIYAINAQVIFEYETIVYYGRMDPRYSSIDYELNLTEDLRLIEPTVDLKAEFLAMAREFEAEGNELIHGVGSIDIKDFDASVERAKDHVRGVGLPDGWVPAATYWLIRQQRLVGTTNLRYELNDFLREIGGHIGYSIRPSEQNKGYGTRILALTLEKAAALGLPKVLVTCDKSNTASRRVIEKNGGVLENEVIAPDTGQPLLRYWIDLSN